MSHLTLVGQASLLACLTNGKKVPGKADFEAPTRGVHQGPPAAEAAGRRRDGPLLSAASAGLKNNGPGEASPANRRRGGSPQHDGLGRCPDTFWFSSRFSFGEVVRRRRLRGADQGRSRSRY